jgi:hypothetical protein
MTYTETLDLIQRLTNTQNTTTSSYPVAAKCVDINNALDNYIIVANSVGGNARPADDTNHTKAPVVYFDIVLGQQDYYYTVDEDGNQITSIEKIRVKDPNGKFITLTQINKDELTDGDLDTSVSGTPSRYYLIANGIFLVETPNYNSTDGGEFTISRTSYHFTVSDTTKVAGIPLIHGEYLALRPSYFYCLSKGLPQAVDYRLRLYGNDGKGGMEEAIRKFWRDKNRDYQDVITSEPVNSI